MSIRTDGEFFDMMTIPWRDDGMAERLHSYLHNLEQLGAEGVVGAAP